MYAATCPLYPGDVVMLHDRPGLGDEWTGREWVVAYDAARPMPYVEMCWQVPLVTIGADGAEEKLTVSARSMLKLIRRAGHRGVSC